jgi:hypothetical protein
MKGHSRGEWYGTLDDIADSAESAEYWAVFGVTHRGNKHCLGEFRTESAAQAAVRGLRYFPPSREQVRVTVPEGSVGIGYSGLSGRRRRIVQLEIVKSKDDSAMIELFALCNDGTVWHRGVGIRGNRGFMEENWNEITLDGIHE